MRLMSKVRLRSKMSSFKFFGPWASVSVKIKLLSLLFKCFTSAPEPNMSSVIYKIN